MKTRMIILGLLMFCLARTPAADSLNESLRKGLLEEEANRNLGAAIEAYQSVLDQFEEQRKIAATAAFRLGESYRKQGKTNEALAQFERVIRDFNDQGALTTLSRKYLAEAGRSMAASDQRIAGPSGSPTILDQAQADLVRQEIALVEQQITEAETRRENGRATAQEVAQLRRELIPLRRKLPENAASLKQQELIQEEIQIVEELLKETAIRVEAGLAGPIEKVALQRDLLGLQRQLLAAQEPPQSSFQTRLNSIVARAAPSSDGVSGVEAEAIQQIKVIIKNSPDLINDLSGGSTPLYDAAKNGHLVVARFLLDNNADVNAGDGSPMGTPLHAAAAAGNKSMVELLLSRGALVDSIDNNRETPLQAAARRGYQAVATVLVEKGADVNAVTTSGRTPLHLAVAVRHKGMVDLLLANKAEVNAADSNGATPLVTAARLGQAEPVKLLLDHGADVNATMEDTRTALSFSVEQRTQEITRLLLASGADANAKIRGTPLLSLSVAAENAPAIELLVKSGAEIDSRDANGQTPLALAVNRQNAALVDLLLREGANPNVKDAQGQTPLTIALSHLRESSRFTLGIPSRPSRGPDPQGAPRARASGGAAESIFLALVNHGATLRGATAAVTEPLMAAVRTSDRDAVIQLLDLEADVNFRSQAGYTPLHVAAASGETNMVELLIAKGANVNAQDDFGNTPLHYAVFDNRGKAVSTLLAHGAKADIMNREDRLPEGMLFVPSSGVPYNSWGIPVKQNLPATVPVPVRREFQPLSREKQEIQNLLRGASGQGSDQLDPSTP